MGANLLSLLQGSMVAKHWAPPLSDVATLLEEPKC